MVRKLYVLLKQEESDTKKHCFKHYFKMSGTTGCATKVTFFKIRADFSKKNS